MKQRVGIARALAIAPKILLMAGPFSALDALTRGTLQDEVRRICIETGQTVFMIIHNVDEAISLADRIALTPNGPMAKVAEIVENLIGRDRDSTALHHAPRYYALRNHLIDVLVSRWKTLRDAMPPGYDPRHPSVVRPGDDGAALTHTLVCDASEQFRLDRVRSANLSRNNRSHV